MNDDEMTPDEIACPFCDTLELMSFNEDDVYWIGCLNCRACGPTASSPEDAALTWLDRPVDDEPTFHGAKRIVYEN